MKLRDPQPPKENVMSSWCPMIASNVDNTTELFEKSFRADPVKTTVNQGVFVDLVGRLT